jgi:hypothetical protein
MMQIINLAFLALAIVQAVMAAAASFAAKWLSGSAMPSVWQARPDAACDGSGGRCAIMSISRVFQFSA